MKLICLITALFMICGCTRITFVNGKPQAATTEKHQHWHHNFANGLYEGSEKVELNSICHGKPWQTVTTEKSASNAIATTAVGLLVPGSVEVWSPKTVTVECFQATKNKA